MVGENRYVALAKAMGVEDWRVGQICPVDRTMAEMLDLMGVSPKIPRLERGCSAGLDRGL